MAYDSEYWTEVVNGSSIIDEDYSSVGLGMEGAQCLRLYRGAAADDCYTWFSLAGEDELWGKILFRTTGWPGVGSKCNILEVLASVATPLASIWIGDDHKLHVWFDSFETLAGYSIALNTSYYIWWHWKRSTGANGIIELFVSTNTTKPGSAQSSITTGSSTSYALGIALLAGRPADIPLSGTNFYYDHVGIYTSTTDWATWEGSTPSPSVSLSISPSLSPSLSPSISPSISRSPSPTPSPSVSPSISPSISPSPSPSASRSPSLSPSISPSVSPSISLSLSPSLSPSPSPTPSVSESPTPSASISPSISPSLSPSASVSPSLSISLSPSASISSSISLSVSPSRSLSPSASLSPSLSPSISPSLSPSVSPSISLSVSPSISPSISPSLSPSASISPSISPSLSPSASISPSISPSLSASASLSPSISASISPSLSPSESPSPSPMAVLVPDPVPLPVTGLARAYPKRDLTKFWKSILCTNFQITGPRTATCDGVGYTISSASYDAILGVWTVRVLSEYRTTEFHFIEGDLH